MPASTRVNSHRFGEVLADRIEALARFSDEAGKLTRLYLAPSHKRAADQVAAWMRAAGMSTRLDAVGTVIGRYEGERAGLPALLLGSHIDTVRNAGRYDGTLGVLAAIAVVDRLRASGRRLSFAVEVVAFGDEEGVRFPGTLTGSRALAGKFDPRVLDEVDKEGISRREALTAFGCDVNKIEAIARDPAGVLGYVEVHIEQGPVLEAENQPVGVVTAIAGAVRGSVQVTGVGGHAGTIPMALRRDAAAAAAEMVLALERVAQADPDVVATAGVFEVADAAVNAVPGRVMFTFDMRSASDDARDRALETFAREVAAIAKRRQVEATLRKTYEAPSAQCDSRLTDALAAAISATGGTPRRLASGAGHDAMSFKDTFPFAMLFVRCRGGVSHHPDEFATVEDMDVAANVLADCVSALKFD
jgi:allantoate deiminase